MLILILLLTAFLLPPGAGVRSLEDKKPSLTPGPTWPIWIYDAETRARSLYLGAHNIKQWEQSQQNISMRRRIPHPQYNRETLDNDIMLLQGFVVAMWVPGYVKDK
ncbi:unnamed protein product, partial [Natator depressus]